MVLEVVPVVLEVVLQLLPLQFLLLQLRVLFKAPLPPWEVKFRTLTPEKSDVAGSNRLGTTFLYTSWTSQIQFWGSRRLKKTCFTPKRLLNKYYLGPSFEYPLKAVGRTFKGPLKDLQRSV